MKLRVLGTSYADLYQYDPEVFYYRYLSCFSSIKYSFALNICRAHNAKNISLSLYENALYYPQNIALRRSCELEINSPWPC